MVANVGFYFCRGFRSRSTGNIAGAFGEPTNSTAVDNIARSSLKNFFRSFLELGMAMESSLDELQRAIPLIGKEHLDAALARGSGVLLLSAHLGNFFLVGSRLAAEGYMVSVLVNPPKDPRLAQLMDAYRLQIGQRSIHSRPRLTASKELHQSMRRNEIVMMIADEYSRRKGIAVQLFGKTVMARRGPATIALRTAAAIVPVCMIRQTDGSLKLLVEPELELDRSGKSQKQIEANMVLITQWLERTVRAYPEQWNWMNIRWSSTRAIEAAAQEPVHQAI